MATAQRSQGRCIFRNHIGVMLEAQLLVEMDCRRAFRIGEQVKVIDAPAALE